MCVDISLKYTAAGSNNFPNLRFYYAYSLYKTTFCSNLFRNILALPHQSCLETSTSLATQNDVNEWLIKLTYNIKIPSDFENNLFNQFQQHGNQLLPANLFCYMHTTWTDPMIIQKYISVKLNGRGGDTARVTYKFVFCWRIHFGQISSNQMLLSVIDELRTNTISKVREIRVSTYIRPAASLAVSIRLAALLTLSLSLRMCWALTAQAFTSCSGRLRAKKMWCSLLMPQVTLRRRRERGERKKGPYWPSHKPVHIKQHPT